MHYLTSKEVQFLELKANQIRQSIIEMLVAAGSGHTAGPLGMADILTLLYFKVLQHDPKNPTWSERDRLILSNGHICPVLYATLAHAGYFPTEELLTLRKFGSRLQGHPHRTALPGLETSSGPLGSGLSQAVGMALAERIDNPYSSKYIYCLTGDGELNEGQVWEAALQAGKEKLHNLIVIVDRNGIQIDGYTKDVMPLEPLAAKFEAFNFDVQEVDGHNVRAVNDAIGKAQAVYSQPSLIIAHTIASKGVDVFERDFRWHGNPPGKGPEDRVPKDKQAEVALEKLRTLAGIIAKEDIS
ncbi:transketolase [Candidatus Kaiserbacteria bacterium RIFCSPLOWO2_02_FULL_45_11b]|uniref:Transketolase n=1 Tax=Candidatus Kaiserbacteria bacterium RIFCSPLOWO2_12_FULL_45_26 TaxID=1798525 RepID=A0A1F6FHH7_9BACT|nr:MAG: transketolase [Candidatus Kaiserbacteria bacterium RIFCSPHIGHO2_12_45_16]OGG70143.1 MAG: transketolase [Candidatus Kaiserbacteria bacterium RIFCSPLOWO2_01_FULL_45_25]OGG83816.1 MAG: transketolase [Candidatus Kaiserbacteria bacterium RIFCSPLOWO2_02_FULL_45_11b]OGG85314.1 MAG: transketolase [Candidatus Kaiserbacteria bacterium RIFCSPLOWO2_12_FULL_45_26]